MTIVYSGQTFDVQGTMIACYTQIKSAWGGVCYATSVIESQLTVLEGGASYSTYLFDGTERVYGTPTSSTIDAGSDAQISAGGALFVSSGGVAKFAKVRGSAFVSSGGVASGTVVSSGGREYVSAGGIDRFSVVSSGGLEFIASAATISGTTIVSGAKLTVSSGGVVQAGLVLSGGSAAISGSMAAGQQVKFDGAGGTLALYNLPSFAAVISGFSAGDQFDLGGFAYSAGETRSFVAAASHTSGTLTVVAGAKTAKLTLLGSYATSNFALASDGAGGTFVKFV